MDNLKKMPKQYLIFGGVVVVLLLIIVGLMVSRGGSNTQQADVKPTEAIQEPVEVIPTVDASVKVNIEYANGKRDMMLTIDGFPEGSESIEYVISYETEAQGLQGLNGIIDVAEDAKGSSIEKEMTVGTCSSGTCVYHEVSGPVKVELKFTGSYGDRIFEKEFDI